MTTENFCYWMQGFAELTSTPPTQEQWDLIKEHLSLVFEKQTSQIIEKKTEPKIRTINESHEPKRPTPPQSVILEEGESITNKSFFYKGPIRYC
jgi:hypothetical protein